MVVHTCNPSTWSQKFETSLGNVARHCLKEKPITYPLPHATSNIFQKICQVHGVLSEKLRITVKLNVICLSGSGSLSCWSS
jgi:hypothetical protein